jgi:hypothetical protein
MFRPARRSPRFLIATIRKKRNMVAIRAVTIDTIISSVQL